MQDTVEKIRNAELEADKIIKDAEAQAERIISDAKAKADNIIKNAKEKSTADKNTKADNAKVSAQEDFLKKQKETDEEILRLNKSADSKADEIIDAVIKKIM